MSLIYLPLGLKIKAYWWKTPKIKELKSQKIKLSAS